MKKMMMLAAMLALVLAAAVPAVAQIENSVGQEVDESGEIALEGSVTSTGDYASQCVSPLQFGQTGNDQNGQSFLQYSSESDDLEASGNEFSFEPALSFECSQAVQQSSAASSG